MIKTVTYKDKNVTQLNILTDKIQNERRCERDKENK
jgi:hypothetical protein